MLAHLGTLVPGQCPPQAGREIAHGVDQAVANRVSGPLDGQMPEHDIAAGPLTTVATADRPPAPRMRSPSQCPRDRPLLDITGALGQGCHRVDESARARLRVTVWFPATVTAVQGVRQLTLELVVQRDSFGASASSTGATPRRP